MTVAEQRNALSAVGAAAEGENTTTTFEGAEMSIDQGIRSSLTPIYGPSDHRWDELAHYFEIHAEKFISDDGAVMASMEMLDPGERVSWHSRHILGMGHIDHFDVQFPPFPEGRASAPAWSTASEDPGIDAETQYPVRVFRHEFTAGGLHGALSQEAMFNPDTDEVTWGEASASVWVDGNTRVQVTDPVDALNVATVFLRAVDELRKLVP